MNGDVSIGSAGSRGVTTTSLFTRMADRSRVT